GTRYWGSSMIFSSSVGGALPLAYQWQKDGVPLAGATNTSLILSNLPPSSAGNYTLVASNAYGIATSSAAPLTVKIADMTLVLPGGGQQGAPGLTIAGVPGQVYGIQYAAGFSFPM